MWETDIILLYLIIHDLTTSRNNIQHDAKKVLITIIIALLFPILRFVICQIFPVIFLRSFENVAPCCGQLTSVIIIWWLSLFISDSGQYVFTVANFKIL